VYKVEEDNDYNSLSIARHCRYTIAPDDVRRDDIDILLGNRHSVPDTHMVPFPQANSFDRVVDLLTILYERGPLTRDDITENYAFDARQTNYYTDAARYLNLMDKYTDADSHEVTYKLTNDAGALLNQRHKVRYIGLIRKILEHEVFYRTFHASLQQGNIPDAEAVADIMKECNVPLNETTMGRRAGTVRRWIQWIWEQIAD